MVTVIDSFPRRQVNGTDRRPKEKERLLKKTIKTQRKKSSRERERGLRGGGESLIYYVEKKNKTKQKLTSYGST